MDVFEVVDIGAAVALAGDFLTRPVYVPSENNPSDKPSRGKRTRPSQCTLKTHVKKTSRYGTYAERRLERMLNLEEEAAQMFEAWEKWEMNKYHTYNFSPTLSIISCTCFFTTDAHPQSAGHAHSTDILQ